MRDITEMTPAEIREVAHQAIVREIGVAGLIRFLQDQSLGSGDYRKDRESWVPDYKSLDELYRDVEERKAADSKP